MRCEKAGSGKEKTSKENCKEIITAGLLSTGFFLRGC